jgi:hypothetical protein
MVALLADRDLAFVVDANGFDHPHQTVGNRPIDLRQVPAAKLLLGIGLDGGRGPSGKALGLAQQFRLILFQGEGPVHAQAFDFFDEGRLKVQSIAYQQIQETAPQVADQILQQGERTGHFRLTVFLETNAQRNGNRRADSHHGHDAMVVLDVGAQFAADLVLHLALHAGVATASKGTADFDAIHGRHEQAAGPIRAQHSVALQTAGDVTTQGEDRIGGLALERIADGVIAERSNPLGQDSATAFGLDLQQAGDLHGRCQEDRIEDLVPGMARSLAPFRQGFHKIGKVEHLIEVGLEAVSGQVYRFSFSLRNLLRLMPQMVAAAASKRRRISTCWRTLGTNLAGMLKVLGLPPTSREI